MKVKCIFNKNRKDELTVGKIYDVNICDKYYIKYFIRGDDGIDYDWGDDKKYFKPLLEIRNEKIDKLLG